MNVTLLPCSIHEKPRTKKVEPFARAGFNVRAAVMVVPDAVLFERQGRSYQEEGKSVSDEKIAAFRGERSMHRNRFRYIYIFDAVQSPVQYWQYTATIAINIRSHGNMMIKVLDDQRNDIPSKKYPLICPDGHLSGS